eukprot:3858280-Rhodomonas_salina.1
MAAHATNLDRSAPVITPDLSPTRVLCGVRAVKCSTSHMFTVSSYAMLLRAGYAVCGTELGYAPTSSRVPTALYSRSDS